MFTLKAKILTGVSSVIVIALIFLWVQNNNLTHEVKAAVIAEATAVKNKEEAVSANRALESTIKKIEAERDNAAAKIIETEKKLILKDNMFTNKKVTLSSFNGRLAKITVAKPGLIKIKINKATKQVFKDIKNASHI